MRKKKLRNRVHSDQMAVDRIAGFADDSMLCMRAKLFDDMTRLSFCLMPTFLAKRLSKRLSKVRCYRMLSNLGGNKRVNGPKTDVFEGQRLTFVTVCYRMLQKEIGC